MLQAYMPDGYFPNGKSRPWIHIVILTVSGKFALIMRVDTKEKMTIPCSAIKFKEEQWIAY